MHRPGEQFLGLPSTHEKWALEKAGWACLPKPRRRQAPEHVCAQAPHRRFVSGSWRWDMKGHQAVSLASASPRCAVPPVANVDAGTVEWIRGLGVEVVSSAELIQIFEAKWTSAQLELRLEAGRRVDRIRHEAFEHIRQVTRAGQPLNEYGVQQFVMRRFQECGLVTNCADFHVLLSKCAKTTPEAMLR